MYTEMHLIDLGLSRTSINPLLSPILLSIILFEGYSDILLPGI